VLTDYRKANIIKRVYTKLGHN